MLSCRTSRKRGEKNKKKCSVFASHSRWLTSNFRHVAWKPAQRSGVSIRGASLCCRSSIRRSVSTRQRGTQEYTTPPLRIFDPDTNRPGFHFKHSSCQSGLWIASLQDDGAGSFDKTRIIAADHLNMSWEMEIFLVPCGEPSALDLRKKLFSYLSLPKKVFDSMSRDIHPKQTQRRYSRKSATDQILFFKSLMARKLPFHTRVLIAWMAAGLCDDGTATLASVALHICSHSPQKCWLIGMFQRGSPLASKTSNKKKKAIGTWLESDLRKSNLSFSNCVKAERSCEMAENSLCFMLRAHAVCVLLLYMIPPVLKMKPSNLHCSFFLRGSGHSHTPNVILIRASVPFITELFLLTQTKRDSPRTNYFSFLIGSTAALLVRAYGYS